jgi:hypothetical protein
MPYITYPTTLVLQALALTLYADDDGPADREARAAVIFSR